mgnify:FL=1
MADGRTIQGINRRRLSLEADAQLLAKERVTGSNPVFRSPACLISVIHFIRIL